MQKMVGWGQPKFGCPTFLVCGLDKIFSFFGLREVEMMLLTRRWRRRAIVGRSLQDLMSSDIDRVSQAKFVRAFSSNGESHESDGT
jgi:hypothetical protein